MKIIVDIKKQLVKDIYLVSASAVGLFLLYSGGTVIEKCLHGSKDSSTSSFGIAKEIYKTDGIKGFFKGTTFSIGYKVGLEILKDIHGKVYNSYYSGNSNNNSNNGSFYKSENNNNSANKVSIYNKIKNRLKNNNNMVNNNSNTSTINIKINNSSTSAITELNNNGISLVFNKIAFKSEFLNILNEVLECPLYLIRDCMIISPTKFKFKEFFKSLKSIHIIKLFGYYAGMTILKYYANILIDIVIKEIQNNSDEKKPSSLFNYLKFIVLINNNVIIKSYLQSIILCPIDFIRIQYSLKILESMNLGVPIGSFVETSIPSPLTIIKRNGSHMYSGFNISFLNNILANILVKYLHNIELILNLIIITKNQLKINK